MSSSKRKHSSGKSLFVGCFNWHGEIHTIHTHAFSPHQARRQMLSSLSAKVGYSVAFVTQYFSRNHQAWTVKEVKDATG